MAAAKKTARSDRWAPKRATAAAIDKFEEEFSKSMGVVPYRKPVRPEIVSTGSMALDLALGVGGIPVGRVVEVWGSEHSGKTSAAIIQAVQFQKRFPDRRIAWVDMEQTFDAEWAESLGLDMSRKKMWFYTPQTAEDVADAVKRFAASGLCSLVVLDSVGGMISRIEIEKEADEATVGKVPGIVTRMVKAVSPIGAANGTTLYVINQVRSIIGGYGPDEGTGGGWALKHVTAMKMHVRKGGGEGTSHTVKVPEADKPIPVGHRIAVKVQKNKLAPYGHVAEIWFHNVETEQYGPVGFDFTYEVFQIAKRMRMMGSGAGGNYDVEGVKIKGGEPKVMEYLRENPTVVEVLRSKILSSVEALTAEETAPEADEDHDPLGISGVLDEGQTVSL